MNQCKTCEFWQVTEEEIGYWGGPITVFDPDGFEPVKMPFEVRYCRSAKLQRFERPIERDRASAVDAVDIMQGL